MRMVEKTLRFRAESIDNVIESAYSNATVQRVYGDSAVIGPWNKGGKRKIELSLAKQGGIGALLNCGHGPLINATLTQHVRKNIKGAIHEVHGSVRLRIMGAELIKIRPRTIISDERGVVELRTNVELHAVLPAPLNRLVEDMMAMQAASEIELFSEALQASLSHCE